MPTTTDKPTVEEIRKVHNQQPPSTATKREWEHVDFLLAEYDRLKAENQRLARVGINSAAFDRWPPFG